MAKNPKKEAAVREMRERAAGDNGPTLGEQLGIQSSDWRLNMPKASQFYMVTGSNGGFAHKSLKNEKAGSGSKPAVFYIQLACGPEDGKRVMLANGPDGYPVPYSGDPALKCEYCVKGEKAPVSAADPPKRSRTPRAPKADAAVTWPTYKADEPMAPVTEFFSTLYDHMKDDGLAADDANDRIPDDLRYRTLKALHKLFQAPPEVDAQLDKLYNPAPKRSGRKAAAAAVATPEVETTETTEREAASERLAQVSSENLREEAEPETPTTEESEVAESVLAEPQPEATTEVAPEPEPTPEPSPEGEGGEPNSEPLSA